MCFIATSLAIARTTFRAKTLVTVLHPLSLIGETSASPTATAGWQSLADLTRQVTNPNLLALRLAVDYPTWLEQGMHGKRPTTWQLVLTGLTPSLPTFSEYRARVAVIEEGRRQVELRHEKARHAALAGRRVSN